MGHTLSRLEPLCVFPIFSDKLLPTVEGMAVGSPPVHILTVRMRDTKDPLPSSEVLKQPQGSSGRGGMITTAGVLCPLLKSGQGSQHRR